MTHCDRRAFLHHSAAYAGRAVAGFAALDALAACARSGQPGAAPEAAPGAGGYGPLRPAGPELALPEGFTYRVFGIEGEPMSDGNPTPGRHDGMGAFPLPNGNIRLIRNHEVTVPPRPGGAAGDPAMAYDSGAGGCTTSLEVHPETREMIGSFLSLNGTYRNCAGGPTPWGSWLSCEEAFFGDESGFAAPHGYVFEVPAARTGLERTEPLVEMGRFVHEAAAADPETGILYQTEDQTSAGFYRFVPVRPYRNDRPAELHAGGRLQMLAVEGRRQYDARTRQTVGRVLPVSWVDIENPDPPGGPEAVSAVYQQGFARGGAEFTRLEGCWYGNGGIYFVSTNGGDARTGQVWQYRPTSLRQGELALVFESPHRSVLNHPDDICVSPKGALVLCEDANERRQYLRGLTREGKVFDIAMNAGPDAELTGATFSPDGRTLFFNLQGDPGRKLPGKTVAVWGPWERGAL